MLLFFVFVIFYSAEVLAHEQIVAAYLPEYRFYADIEAAISCCLTDIILFSVSVENDGRIDDHWLPSHEIRRVRSAADSVPDRTVNVLLCVGGAARSKGFASAVSTKSNRNRFIKQLVELVNMYELDGIDFDWEAPQSEVDLENYNLFLKSVSKVLHKIGKLVTVALHPGQTLTSSLSSNELTSPYEQSKSSGSKYVDRIHLMTYDMNSGRKGQKGGHSSIDDSQKAVQFLLDYDGVDVSKIVMGIPAYSRHKVHFSQVKTHAEIVDDLLSSRKNSDLSQKEEEYFLEDIGDVSIDGEYIGNGLQTVQLKTKWGQTVGLGGVMFWEMGHDKLGHPTASLLQAAAKASNWFKGPTEQFEVNPAAKTEL